MTMIDYPRQAGLLDSKSRISELQRKIDELIRKFYESGDQNLMRRAAELSRQKESLLKPAAMRTGNLRRVS